LRMTPTRRKAMKADPVSEDFALSDYWRIDRCADRSRELSSVVGGISSQVDLVQKALRRHTGTREAGYSPLVLDTSLLSSFSAPFPGAVVDCLTGLAVREAALRMLSVDSSELPQWDQLSLEDRTGFERVHRVLEEVYAVDRLRECSETLSLYVEAMRRLMELDARALWQRLAGAPVTREVVVEMWLLTRRGWGMPEASLTSLKQAVDTLDRLFSDYCKQEEPTERLAMALHAWHWLREIPRGPVEGRDGPLWLDESAVADDSEAHALRRQLRKNVLGGAEAGSLADLSAFLMESASSVPVDDGNRGNGASESSDLDLTADLRELGIRAAETHIKNAEYDADAHERVASQVAGEIEAVRHVFARLDAVEARWRHGLDRGRVDGSRLTKAAAGKTRVFKRRERQRHRSMALVFLVDVSASMRSYMPVVNRAACVLSEALRGLAPRVWFEVLTYTSGGLHPGSPVQLTRLATPGLPLSLNGVWTDGGTPTGEAIAAASLVLAGRHAERKLVLHFTDGHPKDTYVVRQALEVCRRSGIDVLSVSVGASQEGLYGAGKCEVAYSVSELPEVLSRLLPGLYRAR